MASETILAGSCSLPGVRSSSVDYRKHLYRHLELSGQREKASTVFETYFGGGRHARSRTSEATPLGSPVNSDRNTGRMSKRGQLLPVSVSRTMASVAEHGSEDSIGVGASAAQFADFDGSATSLITPFSRTRGESGVKPSPTMAGFHSTHNKVDMDVIFPPTDAKHSDDEISGSEDGESQDENDRPARKHSLKSEGDVGPDDLHDPLKLSLPSLRVSSATGLLTPDSTFSAKASVF
jgi:hypothetical protein